MAAQCGCSLFDLPKLPVFSGDSNGCSFEEFEQEAQRIIYNYRLENYRGVTSEWLVQSLAGIVRAEVCLRQPEEINTPGDVLCILRDAFGDRTSEIDLHKAFVFHRQEKGEGIIPFSHSLMVLQKRYNRKVPNRHQISDERVRDFFVEGLYSPEMRKKKKPPNKQTK